MNGPMRMASWGRYTGISGGLGPVTEGEMYDQLQAVIVPFGEAPIVGAWSSPLGMSASLPKCVCLLVMCSISFMQNHFA
jgi:hypothetical protein